nr:glioma pathogenesis protein 1 [Hymenolepis microstoma]
MKMVHVIVIAVLIAWPCSGELTADERSEIITSHNGIRSSVKTSAANMLEMIYDTGLEKDAEKFTVDPCTTTEKTAEKQHANYATQTGDTNWTKLIEEWGNEGKNYKYEDNSCGEKNADNCKHYLQVIWAAAEKVGCAKKECTTPSVSDKDGDKKYGMLCVYNQGPAAELTKPYEQGDPCHKCDQKIYPTCPNNLCSTKLATTTSSTTCISSSEVIAMIALVIGNQYNLSVI